MSQQNFTYLQRNRRLGPLPLTPPPPSPTIKRSIDVHGTHREKEEEPSSSSFSTSLSLYVPLTVPCASMDLLTVGIVGERMARTKFMTVHDEYNHQLQHPHEHLDPKDDIVMYHSIMIHRTLSWQKLLIISCADLSPSYLETLHQRCLLYSDTTRNTEGSSSSSSTTTTRVSVGPTAFTWSPQGRSFVVGLSDGSFLVYDLESYCRDVNINSSSTIDLTSIYSSSIVTYIQPPPVVSPPPTVAAAAAAAAAIVSSHPVLSLVTGTVHVSTETPTPTTDLNMEGDESGKNDLSSSSKIMRGVMTRSTTSSGQQKRMLRRIGKTPPSSSSTNTTTTPSTTSTTIKKTTISSFVPPPTVSATTTSTVMNSYSSSSGKQVDPSSLNRHLSTLHVPAIVAMSWVRFSSCPISSSNSSSQSSSSSYLDEDAWKWHQQYVDRASYYLPPSMYHYSRFVHDTIMGKKKPIRQTQDDYYDSSAYNVDYKQEKDPSPYILGYHHSTFSSSSSSSHFQDLAQRDDRMIHVNPTMPRGYTILNALCILTANQGIYVYLHATFPILHIDSPFNTKYSSYYYYTNTQPAHILCTSDLSTLVTWNTRVQGDDSSVVVSSPSSSSSSSFPFQTTITTSTSLAHIYNIPRIRQERYPLQILTSFYSSIHSHLSTIKIGMRDVITSWNSALRPLDVKFDPMIKLFKDYGIIHSSSHPWIQAQTIRLHLLQYILRGHVSGGTSTSGDTDTPTSHASVSNALDHYFTQASMNDALLVRLSKSMISSLAQLEGTVRKYFTGPMHALLYDVYELYGYAHYFSSYAKNEVLEDCKTEGQERINQQSLIQEFHTRELLQTSEKLQFILEIVLNQLIEVRFRVNNIIEWLRGTAAQVKARGTPMDSVQREHAKKRRVSDSILQHVTHFLSLSIPQSTTGSENHTMGWTESILGITWSNLFLSETFEYFSMDTQRVVKTPSFKVIFDKLLKTNQTLFLQPNEILSKCVQHYEVVAERELHSLFGKPLLVAIHKRSGASVMSENSDTQTGFIPKLVESLEKNATLYNQTQWLIMALYFEGSSTEAFLEIIALPLDSISLDQRYYLTSRLSLPPFCKITDMKFYGDDGCGAFKVENVESIQEGRQALGLIVERNSAHAIEMNVIEELWLFEYDLLWFRCVCDGMVMDDCSRWKIHISNVDGSEDSSTSLRTERDSSFVKESCRQVPLIAKSRVVLTHRPASSPLCSRLIMNGARGVGGLACVDGNSMTIDLFDLEEDEDMDE